MSDGAWNDDRTKAHIVKLGWEPCEWGSNTESKFMARRGDGACTPFRPSWIKVLADVALRRQSSDLVAGVDIDRTRTDSASEPVAAPATIPYVTARQAKEGEK